MNSLSPLATWLPPTITMRDQLKGKLFLEAYAGLKGGGAISEPEGRKATEAMAALNTAQTTEDLWRP